MSLASYLCHTQGLYIRTIFKALDKAYLKGFSSIKFFSTAASEEKATAEPTSKNALERYRLAKLRNEEFLEWKKRTLLSSQKHKAGSIFFGEERVN